MTVNNKNQIIVVSAPSGAGKTTLNSQMIIDCPEIELVVSHTTRLPRSGEVNGTHYHYVSKDDFLNLTRENLFLEWAEVHGNLYGTSKAELDKIQQRGHIPLLEIDVQGWLTAKNKIPSATAIFILPPSLKLLWDRLEARGSDALETRWKRFKNAYEEIERIEYYEFFIVNNNFDTALEELKAAAIGKKKGTLTRQECVSFCLELKREFYNAKWIQEIRHKIEPI